MLPNNDVVRQFLYIRKPRATRVVQKSDSNV